MGWKVTIVEKKEKEKKNLFDLLEWFNFCTGTKAYSVQSHAQVELSHVPLTWPNPPRKRGIPQGARLLCLCPLYSTPSSTLLTLLNRRWLSLQHIMGLKQWLLVSCFDCIDLTFKGLGCPPPKSVSWPIWRLSPLPRTYRTVLLLCVFGDASALAILPTFSTISYITRSIQLKRKTAKWNNAPQMAATHPLYLAMINTCRQTLMIRRNPPHTINERVTIKRNGPTTLYMGIKLISMMLIIID